MCEQHGLKAKGRSAGAPFGVVRCDQLDQRDPGHDLIHLLQKLAFAGFLDAQVQFESCLFHEKGFSQAALATATNFWDLCRVSLELFMHSYENRTFKANLLVLSGKSQLLMDTSLLPKKNKSPRSVSYTLKRQEIRCLL